MTVAAFPCGYNAVPVVSRLTASSSIEASFSISNNEVVPFVNALALISPFLIVDNH